MKYKTFSSPPCTPPVLRNSTPSSKQTTRDQTGPEEDRRTGQCTARTHLPWAVLVAQFPLDNTTKKER